MKVVVEYDSRELHYEHDGQQYGSWRGERSFNVSNVYGIEDNGSKHYPYHSEVFDVDAQYGDPVFVVYVVYSTGDSFGHSTGHGSILGVFTDAKLAMQAKKTLEDNQRDYTLKIQIDQEGNTVEVSNPVAGYFESLEYCNIATFLITPR